MRLIFSILFITVASAKTISKPKDCRRVDDRIMQHKGDTVWIFFDPGNFSIDETKSQAISVRFTIDELRKQYNKKEIVFFAIIRNSKSDNDLHVEKSIRAIKQELPYNYGVIIEDDEEFKIWDTYKPHINSIFVIDNCGIIRSRWSFNRNEKHIHNRENIKKVIDIYVRDMKAAIDCATIHPYTNCPCPYSHIDPIDHVGPKDYWAMESDPQSEQNGFICIHEPEEF